MVFHSPFSHPAQQKYAKGYWDLKNSFEVIFIFISNVKSQLWSHLLIKKYDQIYKNQEVLFPEIV